MKMDDKLSEIFDVEVIKEHDVIKPDGSVIPPENNQAEDDFEKVRNTLHTALDYGAKGVDLAYSISVDTEDPKALEALSKMIKSVTESSAALVEMHGVRARLKPKEPDVPSAGQIVQNQQNVFLGTTAELAKFVNGMKDNK